MALGMVRAAQVVNMTAEESLVMLSADGLHA